MAQHHIYAVARGDEDGPPRRIELAWSRDKDYAQIATTRWMGEGKPDPDAHYLPDRNTDSNDPKRAWEGQFFDLERHQINHLIQQLRIMRDQVYGRDQ